MPFLAAIPAVIGTIAGAGASIGGAVLGSKAKNKATKAAEKAADRQARIQEEQLAEQKRIQAKVEGALSKYLGGDIGFGPEQLALMQTLFMGDQARAFGTAEKSVMAGLRGRGGAGGDLPAGGDFGRLFGTLQSGRAGSQAAGVNDIRLRDAGQKLANQFNAAGVIQGNAGQINPAYYGANANNAMQLFGALSNSGVNPWATALGAAGGLDWGSLFNNPSVIDITGNVGRERVDYSTLDPTPPSWQLPGGF